MGHNMQPLNIWYTIYFMRIERTIEKDVYYLSNAEVRAINASEDRGELKYGVLENTGDGGAKITFFNDVAGQVLPKAFEKLAKDLDFEFTGDAPLQQN